MSRVKAIVIVMCGALLWAFVAPATAQESDETLAAMVGLSEGGPNTPWGAQRGAKWISAMEFTGKMFTATPALHFCIGAPGYQFMCSPGSTTPQWYSAPLRLEPGVLVDAVTCTYADSSATNDVSFQLGKSTVDVNSDVSTYEALATANPTATGIRYANVNPTTPFTFTTTDAAFQVYQYTIEAAVANDTYLLGCHVWYKRQVVPGPLSSTFADVPTTSPYFKYVEALVSSGLVGGCTAATYCPNSPVTRGQLAVFLAGALGMGYLY